MQAPDNVPRWGRLIDEARDRQRPALSQNEAARRAGLSGTRWRQVVDGRAGPMDSARGVKTVARMARVAGVTPEQLEEEGRPDVAKELSELLGHHVQTAGEQAALTTETLASRLPPRVRQVLEDGQVQEWHLVDVSSPDSDDVIMVMWVGPKPEDVDRVRRDFAEHRLRRQAVREAATAQQDKWDEIIAREEAKRREAQRAGEAAPAEEPGEDQSNGTFDSG
ncbi:helix-turn-helix domain-containing protein [Actinomadura rubrisoli]|uniref:XRE family transcriptional regulator n=1 Tax=Actinomadura rubrisoli TaxID=2530368 RepID=A0A4R5ACN6_9ACTN|nr:helix-turn-helix transcriptional regulator [Actinomadura rubrisoli]TDD68574.1 XRE family transcriptional regulator [Actinomadura rubrisoli]